MRGGEEEEDSWDPEQEIGVENSGRLCMWRGIAV